MCLRCQRLRRLKMWTFQMRFLLDTVVFMVFHSFLHLIMFINYFSVIKFKVILIERRQNKGSIIHGKVGRVIKQNNVTIHKGRVKIWSNTESTCPSLRTGNIFLIGGYENALRRKLLLTSKSLIESWNEGTMRKIRKWQKGERNVLTKIQGRRWVFS